MKLIVNVTENWGIGSNGDLLCSIPEDMKFFRKTTTGAAVVMGRKTLDSFPNGKPLKNRTNIVITRNPEFVREGVTVCHTKDEVLVLTADTDNVFVIGGGEIYRMFLDDCDTAYVTKVHTTVAADTFFPNLDAANDWECTYISEDLEYNNTVFNFCTYTKK